MLKNMEQMVNDKYGVKLDELAIALMKRDFMITEIAQESDGRTFDTTIAMNIDGSELTMKLSKRVGF